MILQNCKKGMCKKGWPVDSQKANKAFKNLWVSCPRNLCAKLYIVNTQKQIQDSHSPRESSNTL